MKRIADQEAYHWIKEWCGLMRDDRASRLPSHDLHPGKTRNGLVLGFAQVDQGRELRATDPAWEPVRVRARIKRAEKRAALKRQAAETPGRGLSDPSNLETGYGKEGLSARAGDWVLSQGKVLQMDRPKLRFRTDTIGREDLDAFLAAGCCWSDFQRELLKEYRRLLKKHGLPDLLLYVVEVQEKRFRETGIPVPHIHTVLIGRNTRHPLSRWVITFEMLDDAYRRVFKRLVGHFPVSKSFGNTQNVQRAVDAYLAKYMAKGGSKGVQALKDWPQLRVRRWSGSSDALKAKTRAVLPEPTGDFGAWLEEFGTEVDELGLAHVWITYPEDIPVGRIVHAAFSSWEALFDCYWHFHLESQASEAAWKSWRAVSRPIPDWIAARRRMGLPVSASYVAPKAPDAPVEPPSISLAIPDAHSRPRSWRRRPQGQAFEQLLLRLDLGSS